MSQSEKAVVILNLLRDLWELKKYQYVGLQPLYSKHGKMTKEVVTNQFSCFFNGEFVDTSVGGNSSPLYDYSDDELIELLTELIQGSNRMHTNPGTETPRGDEGLEEASSYETFPTTRVDYINLGYLIAKYESLLVWRVELDSLPDGRWKLMWAGNGDDEETTIGTVPELIQLMREAIKELEPEELVFK